MEFISILNDVLGPVMRGPSSSHTAGSYHIGRLVRSLLGEEPARAAFTFDPKGSYAATYRQQGVDLALTAGLLGWPITDERFAKALVLAPGQGLRPRFRVAPLDGADHPNTVAIEARRTKRPEASRDRPVGRRRDGLRDPARRPAGAPRRQVPRGPGPRRRPEGPGGRDDRRRRRPDDGQTRLLDRTRRSIFIVQEDRAPRTGSADRSRQA